MAYREKGAYEKALADINQAITLKPDYTHAYKEKGIALHEQGSKHYEEALAAFNQAISLDHDYADAYARKGKRFIAFSVTRRDSQHMNKPFAWAIVLLLRGQSARNGRAWEGCKVPWDVS